MENFSLSKIAKELSHVGEEGISFENKTLTWNTADDVKDVVDALLNKKVVHFLKLDGNTLGVEAAAAIGKALEKHPEFRSALWSSLFTRRLLTEIPQALTHLGNGLIVAKAQLTTLDLSDNALGPNGMKGLEELLRSPVCFSLHEIRLNNCGLGIGGGGMLSKALIDCHRNSTVAGTPLKLKIFIAGRNRLENEGAKAIANMFSTLKTLEQITMPQNSIYHEGITALAEAFKSNPNLQVLNLNDNTVTQEGAIPLSDAFAYLPNLREIDFGDCLLRTDGAYNFGAALEDNHTKLEIVDFGFNEIGSDGGLVLATAMLNKPKLKSFNLDGNQFGFEGCERIKEIMEGALNPNALESFDGDEKDEDEGASDEDNDGNAYNDTTEEADEDDEYQDEYDDESEETAYTTTQAYTTKMLNENESLVSYKSVTSALNNSNNTTLPSNAITAESFCLSQKPCTLQMFELLKEENKLEAFKAIINQFNDDNHLLVLVFTTLKCGHLAKVSPAALELAVALYKEACDYAVSTKQERRVLNYFLIQLGLLRSEKKFNSPYNLESCRYALRETLNKKQISSEHMKNAFGVFLENGVV